MAVVIGSTSADEWVMELGDTPRDGGPERAVSHKGYAQTFPTYEVAVSEAFESGILDEAKWGIEER